MKASLTQSTVTLLATLIFLHHQTFLYVFYPEAASNKLAQIWNEANLSTAKTITSARTLAEKWYNQNATLIQ